MDHPAAFLESRKEKYCVILKLISVHNRYSIWTFGLDYLCESVSSALLIIWLFIQQKNGLENK